MNNDGNDSINNNNNNKNMGVQVFRVGAPSPIIRDHDCQIMTLSGGGFEVYTFMTSPSEKEIQAYKKGAFQVRAGSIGNTMYWVTKFETFSFDCTYCPHIEPYFTALQPITDNRQGYATCFKLIDTKTGIVKAIRFITFSNAFSLKLKRMYDEICSNDADYNTSLQKIYSHSMPELSRMASAYCKFESRLEI